MSNDQYYSYHHHQEQQQPQQQQQQQPQFSTTASAPPCHADLLNHVVQLNNRGCHYLQHFEYDSAIDTFSYALTVVKQCMRECQASRPVTEGEAATDDDCCYQMMDTEQDELKRYNKFCRRVTIQTSGSLTEQLKTVFQKKK